MLRSIALAFALAAPLAFADTPASTDPAPPGTETSAEAPPADTPPAPAEPALAEPPAATQLPAAPPAQSEQAAATAEQKAFDQYRHDLINLLALRADADLLVAAAELAYPDAENKKRPAVLKSPSLLKRAQKFGPDNPLVWWVSTFMECTPKAKACTHEAAAKLQEVDADNAAAWLPALHAEKDAGRARALIASMAQAKRFNDFWSPSVLAVYRALQIMPVPEDVLSHGLNATAARLNFATSVGGGFMPNFQRLGELCTGPDVQQDTDLVGDCLAIAHTLESGGTFRSQAVGFSIESSLLPAGTARDVARARQRASAWQKERFLELSARFPREEWLAQAYADMLQEQSNELATVIAFLRNQHVPTDPPQGWQPQDRSGEAPRGPLAPVPGR
ncbi:MAG TPA: hypothetical protein VLB69_13165 [Rudaea sp.]|nr:hypothetical protein [Rudaea sp.]